MKNLFARIRQRIVRGKSSGAQRVRSSHRKLPRTLGELDDSYRMLIRELAKR